MGTFCAALANHTERERQLGRFPFLQHQLFSHWCLEKAVYSAEPAAVSMTKMMLQGHMCCMFSKGTSQRGDGLAFNWASVRLHNPKNPEWYTRKVLWVPNDFPWFWIPITLQNILPGIWASLQNEASPKAKHRPHDPEKRQHWAEKERRPPGEE